MKQKITKFIKEQLKTETLSGLTVALALVPEAVAFAIVAGVDPLVGLYAAFIVGLITSLFGGRPGMISGATGALAVVMGTLVFDHGVEYLFAAVVLMGVIQIIIGLLKLGKLVRIIPHPVMIGFVNGLAIVIFLAQLSQFKNNGQWMQGSELFIMIALVVATLAIIYILPKITKIIPSALVAIVVLSTLVIMFNINTKTVGDIASISGGLPVFHIPNIPFNLKTFYILLPYAGIFAAIGLIESLMTLTLVDELTNTRGQGNKECIGQGLANFVTGLFGGMGGCAMIGQSMINVKSGGKTRVSSFVAALALLGFILFAATFIERIPIAVLIGVMFSVVIATFEWSSFKIMKHIKKPDLFIIVTVSGITVVADLAIAVIVGVIIAALVFAWEKGKKIEVKIQENQAEKQKVYHINGIIFFGSVHNFLNSFNVDNDNKCSNIVIDLLFAHLSDHSAIEALNTITLRYKNAGKTIHIRNLDDESYKFITDSQKITNVNLIKNPNWGDGYSIATALR